MDGPSVSPSWDMENKRVLVDRDKSVCCVKTLPLGGTDDPESGDKRDNDLAGEKAVDGLSLQDAAKCTSASLEEVCRSLIVSKNGVVRMGKQFGLSSNDYGSLI